MLERLVGVAAWPAAIALYGLLAWQRWSLGRLDDALPAYSPHWQGDICCGCDGTGVARWRPAGGSTHYVRCPACNGHGRDPSGATPSAPASRPMAAPARSLSGYAG